MDANRYEHKRHSVSGPVSLTSEFTMQILFNPVYVVAQDGEKKINWNVLSEDRRDGKSTQLGWKWDDAKKKLNYQEKILT